MKCIFGGFFPAPFKSFKPGIFVDHEPRLENQPKLKSFCSHLAGLASTKNRRMEDPADRSNIGTFKAGTSDQSRLHSTPCSALWSSRVSTVLGWKLRSCFVSEDICHSDCLLKKEEKKTKPVWTKHLEMPQCQVSIPLPPRLVRVQHCSRCLARDTRRRNPVGSNVDECK